ncbi:hypothetical protein COO60DRAFT_1476590 [Scenedesmus sp. NREL 46B-D3]|nr:hypothetical protein COO60DRAFT_1476590 [Scenedesmus sp. NREL 46B-D3]
MVISMVSMILVCVAASGGARCTACLAADALQQVLSGRVAELLQVVVELEQHHGCTSEQSPYTSGTAGAIALAFQSAA